MNFGLTVALLAVVLTALVSLSHATLASREDDLHELLRYGAPHGVGRHRLERFSRRGVRLTAQPAACENVTQHWFDGAVIDNFAPIEAQQRWLGLGQRYWLNKQFWGGPGYPIIAFIGGEGEESCLRLTSRMYAFDLAREHRALLVNAEHRFYGQSLPTADASTASLRYLSSQQALADLARLLQHVKGSLQSERSKVLTVGGSYPGNLAAWFRLKYPSSTHASIASSAPLTAQTNFPEYMDVVAQALIHFSGQKCFSAFELAAEVTANLLLQGLGSAGASKVESDFATCGALQSDKDVAVLLSDLMGNVQGTVQYNNEKKGVMNVTDICAVMTEGDDAYGNFVTLQKLYRAENGQDCEDASWKDTVQSLSQNSAGRSWTYQTCNEFGYYQTTDSKNQPFSSWKWLNLDFSRDICSAAFDGWKVDPQVQWINAVYGATHIDATNVVLPAGTIDPWHALGVSNVTAPLPQASESALYIEGTAHCHDLYAPANSDPASLVFARQVIADKVRKWLA